VLAALDRPGVWQFHAFTGEPMGLAMAEAVATLHKRLNRDLAQVLFSVAEQAFVTAWRTANRDPSSDGQ
jgi:hypothetical protein